MDEYVENENNQKSKLQRLSLIAKQMEILLTSDGKQMEALLTKKKSTREHTKSRLR